MRRYWRTQGWQRTSKTLISLGVDEKLYYLYRRDDTEGIVIIREYFRLRATQTTLHHGHFATLPELERLKFVTPFLSSSESILCLFCVDLYWHPQWDFNLLC